MSCTTRVISCRPIYRMGESDIPDKKTIIYKIMLNLAAARGVWAGPAALDQSECLDHTIKILKGTVSGEVSLHGQGISPVCAILSTQE